jgi:hypothetical protein
VVAQQQEIKVDNNLQQTPTDLAGYISVTDWFEANAGAFFETRPALDWFIKRNRRELIEADALITRGGRSGSLVSQENFPKAVVWIFKRRALEKSAPEICAAGRGDFSHEFFRYSHA